MLSHASIMTHEIQDFPLHVKTLYLEHSSYGEEKPLANQDVVERYLILRFPGQFLDLAIGVI